MKRQTRARRRCQHHNLAARRRPQVECLEPRQLLTTITLVASQDNTLIEDSDGGLSNGSGDFLFVGRTDQPEGRSLRRGMVLFDLVDQIPDGATIDGVSLTLNMSRTISGPQQVSLHRVQTPWGEGVSDATAREGRGDDAADGDSTWLHSQFPDLRWSSPGGDFVANASSSLNVDDAGQYTWSTPRMVDDVQAWLDNPDENFGWLLLGNEDATRSAKRFDSSENSDVANRPMLTIDFTEAAVTPTLTVIDATAAEGDNGTTMLSFPVTLSSVPSEIVTVQYATMAGTASEGVDYQPATGELAFTPNDSITKEITVTINSDHVTEADEIFTLELTNPVGLEIADGMAVGTIINDDPDPELLIEDVSITEGDFGTSTTTVTVELSHPSDFEITVDYATLNGTAEGSVDYVGASGNLTFAPGTTSQTFELAIIGDGEVEADESFLVQLSNPVNAQATDNSASVQIIDNDQTGSVLSLSVADAVLSEGNEGTSVLSFEVTLSEAPDTAVMVQYATSAGTATEGDDFDSAAGALVYVPGGPLTQSIVVNVKGDQVTESDETLFVELTNAVGAQIADGQAVGTITNDDPVPTLTSTDVSVTEGDGDSTLAAVAIELTHPSAFEITVDYATVGGTADEGTDFASEMGLLTFQTGETSQSITVSIFGDTDPEEAEAFLVQLSNPVNAQLGSNSVTISIIDDDTEVSETPWQNSVLPEDVSGDGEVVPRDALLVINYLNTVGPGPLPPPTLDEPPPFYDVSGDNQATPIDALRVINLLNAQNPLAAPPTSQAAAQSVHAALADIAMADLGDEEDNDQLIANS